MLHISVEMPAYACHENGSNFMHLLAREYSRSQHIFKFSTIQQSYLKALNCLKNNSTSTVVAAVQAFS